MAIEIHELSVSYGRTHVIDNLTLTINQGITGLLGVNGAGKTTMIEAIVGGKKPNHGYARAVPRTTSDAPTSETPRLAYMPQDLTFPPFMRLAQTVAYCLWLRGYAWKDSYSLADEALEKVGLLDRRNRPVGTLSGGMQRRLALAATIAGQPDIVILDEPSTGLDPAQRSAVVEIISSLSGTILVSSHILEDVYHFADNVVVLHEGEALFSDSLESFLAKSDKGHAASSMWNAFQAVTGIKDTSR